MEHSCKNNASKLNMTFILAYPALWIVYEVIVGFVGTFFRSRSLCKWNWRYQYSIVPVKSVAIDWHAWWFWRCISLYLFCIISIMGTFLLLWRRVCHSKNGSGKVCYLADLCDNMIRNHTDNWLPVHSSVDAGLFTGACAGRKKCIFFQHGNGKWG